MPDGLGNVSENRTDEPATLTKQKWRKRQMLALQELGESWSGCLNQSLRKYQSMMSAYGTPSRLLVASPPEADSEDNCNLLAS